MNRRLVVRADDAGGCHSANRAVQEVCAAGVVRNASLMACGPAFAEAAQIFTGWNDLCIGLHVVLNAEWAGPKWGPTLPHAQVPTLVDPQTGYFLPTPHHLYQRGFSVSEAIGEAEAQLARAREAGLKITYLDEHMGVGWLPGLRAELAALAHREGLIDAIALNLPSPPVQKMESESPADFWLDTLAGSPPETWLFVSHPGHIAPDMEAFYLEGGEPGIIARERDAERRMLANPALRAACEARGVTLLRYDEV